MARPPADDRPTRPHSTSLLTDDVKDRIVANLRTGVPIPAAAQAAGIAPATVADWLVVGRRATAKRERGERITDHEQACVQLSTEANQVFQEVHLLLAGRVVKASENDWRAATWMLQRRHPEAWNLPDKVEVTGRDGGPIQVAEVEERVMETITVAALERPHGNGADGPPEDR